MCSFGSCKTRFEFLSQLRKVRNVFECFVTQVQTRLPKTKHVWPMKINVICTVFATSLETLAVKAFGDMGQTARLRLIWDIFIAGHSNCDLRRHLDSVPPETPIRDVVDRCRVWESHADPAVCSKPSPDPIYPAYVIGDADNNIETTRVAAVTGQRSSPNQLEDLLRRVLAPAEPPAPKLEVPAVEKLLQQLMRETQSRPPAVVSPPVPTELEHMLRSFLKRQRQRQWPPPRQRPARRDWTDVVCFSCGKSGHAATRCPKFDESFPFMQPGWWTEKTPGGFIMIPPRVTTDRQRAENSS